MTSRLPAGALRVAVFLVAFAVAGCSDDPEGPGTLVLRVSGAPLGAVVIELEGEGLRGVEQPATGWAELVPVAPRDGRPVHRLVVIRTVPGEITARLAVTDVATVRPVATVLEAAGGDDRLVSSTASLRISIGH